jgi:hypothetical protein
MFHRVVPCSFKINARVVRAGEPSPASAVSASACSHSLSESSLEPTRRAIAERSRRASASASLSPASRANCSAGATARWAAGALPTSM